MLSGILIGTEFAALVVVIWLMSRRQERAQKAAVQLLGVLREMRGSASVVVRANGQIEAEVRSAEQEPSSELLGSSEPQLIYQGELYRKTSDPMASRKTGRRELVPGPVPRRQRLWKPRARSHTSRSRLLPVCCPAGQSRATPAWRK